MKRLLISMGIISSLVISFLVGNIYQSLNDENRNEDIIRKEISLLGKYRNQPSCFEIKNNSNRIHTLKENDVIIVWKYYPETNILNKVLINNEFIIAYDKLKVISGNNKCDFTQIAED